MFKSIVLIAVLFSAGCASGNVAAPAPECDPHGVGVTVIVAPEDIDVPECTEVALEEPALNVGRREWCCQTATAPSLNDLDTRTSK